MLPDSFSLGFLQIAYRPDLGQLTGRWLRSVDETELHEGYAALRLRDALNDGYAGAIETAVVETE